MQHETQTHRGTAGTAASNTGLFRERGLREDRGFEFPASESGSISSYSDFFGDAWRVMTIDHVQSSSKGPFKMQFCSDHSWLMLNYVSVVFPLSCFAHVVMLFLVSNVSFVPTQKNWGNVGIFVFLVLKVHLSKSPNSRLLKNHICGSKGFLHFPQIKWK